MTINNDGVKLVIVAVRCFALELAKHTTETIFSDVKSVGSISPGKAIIGGIARLDIGGWPLISITDCDW